SAGERLAMPRGGSAANAGWHRPDQATPAENDSASRRPVLRRTNAPRCRERGAAYHATATPAITEPALRPRQSGLTWARKPAHQRPMYTLAHLSDVHLGNVGLPRPDLLLSKRVLGFIGWHLHRKAVHRGEVLAALVTDLHHHRPDHTAVTGDLVNISLPEEFRRAASWLERLGSPTDVSVVPGNHDAYVSIPWDRSLALWDSYMSGDGPAESRAGDASEHFPYVRRR